MSEKFCAWRNASLLREKNAHVSRSASSGAIAGAAARRRTTLRTPGLLRSPSGVVVSLVRTIVSQVAAGAQGAGRHV
jgi:hypothetical protein